MLRLVCEGKCNPYLADYDATCERQSQFGDVKQFQQEQSRELVHTEHEMVKDEYYDTHMGWIKKYRCVVCGHTRRF